MISHEIKHEHPAMSSLISSLLRFISFYLFLHFPWYHTSQDSKQASGSPRHCRQSQIFFSSYQRSALRASDLDLAKELTSCQASAWSPVHFLLFFVTIGSNSTRVILDFDWFKQICTPQLFLLNRPYAVLSSAATACSITSVQTAPNLLDTSHNQSKKGLSRPNVLSQFGK
jgi:hypothetical protein